MAEPKPVRNVLGSVPLQNCRMGFGPLAMDWMVPRRVLERDCWTRVLRRSAGWRRTADRMPEFKPAKKWTEPVCQPLGSYCHAPMPCHALAVLCSALLYSALSTLTVRRRALSAI